MTGSVNSHPNDEFNMLVQRTCQLHVNSQTAAHKKKHVSKGGYMKTQN